MTWTVDDSDTTTPTVGTVSSLATSTTNGTFVFEADLAALVAGETVQLVVNGTTLASGTAHKMWQGTYTAPLVCPRVASPPIASDISINVTLKQIGGTARAFPWKLLRI